MLANGLEEVSHVAVGRPVGHRDGAPGLAHPQQAPPRRFLLVGGEHDAEGREDHVEGGVLEGQVFGVALSEVYREAFRLGPLASFFEQHRDVVDGGHVAKRRAAAREALPLPEATSRTLWPG